MVAKVRTVLVGVDPSPGARAALDWATTAAGAFGAELVVVHARGLLEGGGGRGDGAPGWLVEMADTVDPGVAIRVLDEPGSPAEVMVRVAEREDAGLVVVGRRGAGASLELSLGSTSREVASRCAVPVLVVPQ